MWVSKARRVWRFTGKYLRIKYYKSDRPESCPCPRKTFLRKPPKDRKYPFKYKGSWHWLTSIEYEEVETLTTTSAEESKKNLEEAMVDAVTEILKKATGG